MGQVEKYGRACGPFRGFGRSECWPFPSRLHVLAVERDFAALRRTMREHCPQQPGVYGMLDACDELIYVGMSLALRKRLTTYFQGGETVRKEHCIAAHAKRLVWEVVGHELTAQLRELELIRRHQPRFNVKGRERIRPLGYIYFSDEAAPRVRYGRRVPKAVRYFWGPLAITWRIREAVEIVNRLFKLCDCPAIVPMHFAEQKHLFALDLRLECLRGETGSCLGPCAGQCTRGEYTGQLEAARAFLDGRDTSPLARLEQQLIDTAARQQYERAAQLRDQLERVRFLSDRLALLREPPLPEQFIYPLRVRERPVWYAISAGRVVGATPIPVDRETAVRCFRRLRRAFRTGQSERVEVDRPAAQIITSWFRNHPAERQTILLPPEAMQFCQKLRVA